MSIVQSSYSNTTNTRKNKLKNQISSGLYPPPVTLRPSASFLFGAPPARFWAHLLLWTWTFGWQWPDFASPPRKFKTQQFFKNVKCWFRMNWKASGTKTHHQPWPKATLLYLVLLLLQHRSCPLRWTQLCKLPQSFSGLHGLTSQTVPLQLLFLLLKHGTLPSKWIGNSCKLFLQNNVGHLSNTTLSVYSTISWADPYGTAGLPSFPVKGWFQLPNLPGWTSNMPRLLPGGTQLKAIEDASNRTQRLNPVGRDRGRISGPGVVGKVWVLPKHSNSKAWSVIKDP